MNFSQKENQSPVYSPFKAYDGIKLPQEILLPQSQSFGLPKPGTSRVIEALHQTIDELREELNETRTRHETEKSRNEAQKKRIDSLVEQLANAKHDNDMSAALFARRDRRIAELEERLQTQMSSTEDYKFSLASLETRCKRLQESERVATAEFERMKIAYETVVTSQKEYREYYEKEIKALRERLMDHIAQRDAELAQVRAQLESADAGVAKSARAMSDALRRLEAQYATNTEAVAATLKLLALASKAHGADTQLVLNQCNAVFVELRDRFNLDVDALVEKYRDAGVENTLEQLLLPRLDTKVEKTRKNGLKKEKKEPEKEQKELKEPKEPKEQKEHKEHKEHKEQKKTVGVGITLPAPPSRRHLRRISSAKAVDFSEFETPKIRSPKVVQSPKMGVSPDWRMGEEDEGEEGGGEGEEKKKKKRRRRKKRELTHNLPGN